MLLTLSSKALPIKFCSSNEDSGVVFVFDFFDASLSSAQLLCLFRSVYKYFIYCYNCYK